MESIGSALHKNAFAKNFLCRISTSEGTRDLHSQDNGFTRAAAFVKCPNECISPSHNGTKENGQSYVVSSERPFYLFLAFIQQVVKFSLFLTKDG